MSVDVDNLVMTPVTKENIDEVVEDPVELLERMLGGAKNRAGYESELGIRETDDESCFLSRYRKHLVAGTCPDVTYLAEVPEEVFGTLMLFECLEKTREVAGDSFYTLTEEAHQDEKLAEIKGFEFWTGLFSELSGVHFGFDFFTDPKSGNPAVTKVEKGEIKTVVLEEGQKVDSISELFDENADEDHEPAIGGFEEEIISHPLELVGRMKNPIGKGFVERRDNDTTCSVYNWKAYVGVESIVLAERHMVDYRENIGYLEPWHQHSNRLVLTEAAKKGERDDMIRRLVGPRPSKNIRLDIGSDHLHQPEEDPVKEDLEEYFEAARDKMKEYHDLVFEPRTPDFTESVGWEPDLDEESLGRIRELVEEGRIFCPTVGAFDPDNPEECRCLSLGPDLSALFISEDDLSEEDIEKIMEVLEDVDWSRENEIVMESTPHEKEEDPHLKKGSPQNWTRTSVGLSVDEESGQTKEIQPGAKITMWGIDEYGNPEFKTLQDDDPSSGMTETVYTGPRPAKITGKIHVLDLPADYESGFCPGRGGVAKVGGEWKEVIFEHDE